MPDDRAAALKALGADRVKRLVAYARFANQGLDHDAEDLLQGAYSRWMGSDVPMVGPDETYGFLIGAINSQRFNEFRRKRTIEEAFGRRLEPEIDAEEDPVDLALAGGASPEDSVFAQQIYDHLGHDPDVQLLVLQIADRVPRADIKRELGWDDKKYDAVQKRRIRMAAKLKYQGKV
ncbi:MAG: hypothetical protein ACKVRO_07600 [Micropepsaceae bacterium]